MIGEVVTLTYNNLIRKSQSKKLQRWARKYDQRRNKFTQDFCSQTESVEEQCWG